MTQKTRVLQWLQEGKTLTRLQGIVDLGIWELPARISELKRDGWPIETEMIGVQNRWGEKCRVAQYWMEV